ncbi:hypothetical protein [Amycolatopsis pigmentata]|uniref:Uncharacterized protein n=1 Tax=Amycolatopsis pigmentata TaxID=450801 RepID=A0ABW5G569_9PSEU
METLKRIALVFALMVGLIAGLATPAQAEEIHAYTPQNPSYESVTAGGTFTGQVSFSGPTYAWSVQIALDIQAGIVGPVVENTTLTCDGKVVASSHHIEQSDYLFHGSSAVDTDCNKYVLDGTLQFTYQGAVGTVIIYDPFVVRAS